MWTEAFLLLELWLAPLNSSRAAAEAPQPLRGGSLRACRFPTPSWQGMGVSPHLITLTDLRPL